MHDWKGEVRARLGPLNLKPEREADIVDEISQHLAERYRDAMSAGASPDEATRLALAEFRASNVLAKRIASLKQAHAPAAVTVGASTGHLFADLWQDLRYALRAFSKHRTFAVTAVLTLALGIGATTAVFSVVYSVLIKPLPYPNADELVRIRHPQAAVDATFDTASSNMYLTYREENSTLASVGLWQETDATLNDGRVAERVRVLRVTDGTLQALGVPPMRGRQFVEAEHGPAVEGPTPVILSYAFWQRRFGGDEAAIGNEISVESTRTRGTLPLPESSQVVGIMPPDFQFLNMTPPPDIILPVRLDPASQNHGGRFSLGCAMAIPACAAVAIARRNFR